jgi:hypothetical protein
MGAALFKRQQLSVLKHINHQIKLLSQCNPEFLMKFDAFRANFMINITETI